MVPQPRTRNACRLSHAHGLGSSAFAHHYSRNHYCFLFLRVLRCFTSPRSHQPAYTFSRRRHPMTSARFPHSEIPGSKSGCRLPEAYRRLPRPSSAPDAKASTVCPKKLEHTKTKELFSKKDARVHYAVLKTRTDTNPQPPPNHHTHKENPASIMRYGGQDRPARHNPTHQPGRQDHRRLKTTDTNQCPFPQDPTV